MFIEKNEETEDINYGALNEEFGDVDISDEEDQIQHENEDAKSARSHV